MFVNEQKNYILKVKVLVLLVSLFSAIAEIWLMLFNILESSSIEFGALIFFMVIAFLSVSSMVTTNNKEI